MKPFCVRGENQTQHKHKAWLKPGKVTEESHQSSHV